MADLTYSIRKAIDDFQLGDLDGAMIHACAAVEGTAVKLYPGLADKTRLRFVQTLRNNYNVLGPMSFPGIDLEKLRWPVMAVKNQRPDFRPDTADVIYGIHRGSHMHGVELPGGFELIPDALNNSDKTTLLIERGKVRMSDRIIFGMLAVAVFNPINKGMKLKGDYFLKLNFNGEPLWINQWWGRQEDFIKLVLANPAPNLHMDLETWFDGTYLK